MNWLTRAACRHLPTDWWYPPAPITPAATVNMHRAKRICATCPVTDQCLEAGMDEDYGIWGGLSPKQRRRIRKETA